MHLVGAAWLSDSTLLIAGSFIGLRAAIEKASLIRDDQSVDLQVRWSGYPRNEPTDRESMTSWVMVARANSRIRQSSLFGLSFSSINQTWLANIQSVATALTDLKTLIRNQFAALDADHRAFIVAFLVSCASDATEDDSTDRLRLSRSLNLVREALRERSPLCELSANRIEGLSVEALMALDEKSFYVEGWMCDIESSAVRLTAVSPEGARTQLLGGLFRYERRDAGEFFRATIGDQVSEEYGFISYFTIAAPSLLPNGWLLEMETAAGTVMEATAPPTITDYSNIRTDLLSDLVHDVRPSLDLRRMHLSPALSALQSNRNRRVHASHVAQFGEQAANPDVSILVPLYGRIDFLEHQMAGFADDPSLREAEFIYVLDSPELSAELLGTARRLFRLYGLAIRVVILSENGGFSTANNIAATFARGRLLLLLNSDVLPRESDWLRRMVAFYDSLSRPGAVGPKLIYEDNSLQHAGLYFDRPPETQMWTNEHYYKGLHSDLPAANVARQVAAVTGACLMIDANLYAAVGGFSGAFVQGDYEDSDLCLRLLEADRENWYLPQVVLYHLEAQSYPTALRRMNQEYNRWLFNEIWGVGIERASARFALPSGTAQLPADLAVLPTGTSDRPKRLRSNPLQTTGSTRGQVGSGVAESKSRRIVL